MVNLHLAYEVKVLNTVWSKSLGFMFRVPKHHALVFPFKPAQKVTFHMWFVFGRLDLLELDETRRVIAIKRNFFPFAWYRTRHKVAYVIELPKGSADLLNIQHLTKIDW